jgi:hypothetical protein
MNIEVNDQRRCWCGGKTHHDMRLDPPDYVCVDGPTHDPFATSEPTKVRRLYVAGPMTGYPDSNYPLFNSVSERLRSAGYEVVNPAEVSIDRPEKVHYVDFLREDLVQMLTCYGICYLPDWWKSTGARNEINVGGLLKMPVRSEAEWLERAAQELS